MTAESQSLTPGSVVAVYGRASSVLQGGYPSPHVALEHSNGGGSLVILSQLQSLDEVLQRLRVAESPAAQQESGLTLGAPEDGERRQLGRQQALTVVP